ncbi:hypothetical protein SUGI_1073920 [Cryptomeria japonica]|nr:hypothetical protein SUGI_1073920 [Cryptomeria japonica]
MIDFHSDSETTSVLRSMESTHYYPKNNIDVAEGKGYKFIMATKLSLDAPIGHFSWAEYDIITLVEPKTEKPVAAAFVSNCEAINFIFRP